jgi:hypothetical protein
LMGGGHRGASDPGPVSEESRSDLTRFAHSV